MKKALILCLVLNLIICNFASCGNPSEENSAVSSSSEISETSEEPKIPENVLYYEGKYEVVGYPDEYPIFAYSEDYANCFVTEVDSCDENGLMKYFENNEVPDDTYFWVTIEQSDVGYYSEENEAVLREYLSHYDFFEATDYKFAKDLLEYRIKFIELVKLDDSGNLINKNSEQLYNDTQTLMAEYLRILIPGIDETYIEEYSHLGRLRTGGYVMGYVSAKALREMSMSEDEYRIDITWMPEPDNYDLLMKYLIGFWE